MSDHPSRILMLTDGAWDHASSRIRAAQYRPLLEEIGYSVQWVPRAPSIRSGLRGRLRFAITKRLVRLRRWALLKFSSWDLVYVQRAFLPERTLAMLGRRGTPLLYDMDDALYLQDPKRTASMVKAAAEVVVSSSELVEFCRDQGAEPIVIPTPVEVDRIRPSPKRGAPGEPLVIGWIGSPWTAPYLQAIVPLLAEVAAQRPLRLLVIGAGEVTIAAPGLTVECEPWAFELEDKHLGSMDVGVMPLPETSWARGKGGYKLLLYMAAGLPVVASPVGINREIVHDGETGFLAADPSTWVNTLIRLYDDPALRQTMGQAGRDLAVARYSRRVCFESLKGIIDRLAHASS